MIPLPSSFTVVNLGAGGDAPFSLPAWARVGSTLVEVDFADEPEVARGNFERRITLSDVIAGTPGPREFTTRSFVSVSGLLEPREELLRKYDIAEHFAPVDRQTVETRTLPDVLAEHGIERVDLLKTDLEGLDLEVLLSSGRILDGAYVVKCELRFEPFFEGEPAIQEALTLLDQRGFGLLSIRTETWQPASPQRRHLVHARDGQTVFADCILVRRLERDDHAGRARQVVLLSGLGQRAVAAHLLHGSFDHVTPESHARLEALVTRPDHEDPTWIRRVLRAGKALVKAVLGRR